MSIDFSKIAAAHAQGDADACAFENLLLREFNRRAEQKTIESFEAATFDYIDGARDVFGSFDGQEPPPISKTTEKLGLLCIKLRVGASVGFLTFDEDEENLILTALARPRYIRYLEYSPKVGCEDPEDEHSYSCHELCSTSDVTNYIEDFNTHLMHVGIYGTIAARRLNCRDAERLFATASCKMNELYVAYEPDECRDADTCREILRGMVEGVRLLWFAQQVKDREEEIESTSKMVAEMTQISAPENSADLGDHARKMGVEAVDFEQRILTIRGCEAPVRFPRTANKAWEIYRRLLTSNAHDGRVSVTKDIKPVKAHFNRQSSKNKVEVALLEVFASFIGTIYKQGEHGRTKGEPAIFLKSFDPEQIKIALTKDK